MEIGKIKNKLIKQYIKLSILLIFCIVSTVTLGEAIWYTSKYVDSSWLIDGEKIGNADVTLSPYYDLDAKAVDTWLGPGGTAYVKAMCDRDGDDERWTVPSTGYYVIQAYVRVKGHVNIKSDSTSNGYYKLTGWANRISGSGSSYSNSNYYTTITTDTLTTKIVTVTTSYKYFYSGAVYDFNIEVKVYVKDNYGDYEVDFYDESSRYIQMWYIYIYEYSGGPY